MKNWKIRNWKTTSAALVAGVSFLAAHGDQVAQVVPPKWQPLCNSVTAVAIAVMGLCSKDAGTPPTTPAAPANV